MKSGGTSAPRLPQTVQVKPILNVGQPEVVGPSVAADRGRIGQTPAKNMLFNFNFRSFQDRMPDDFDFVDSKSPTHDVIGPRAILTLPGIDVSATEIESSIGKNVRWYIWAWVEYDDIFEGTPRHRTEYCCEVSVNRHPVTNEIGIGFPIHGKFIGADGEGFLPYDGHNNRYG